MALVRWDDKYLIGHEVIDHDHQTLFEMINEFHDAFQENKTRRKLLVILSNLVKYSEEHFQREEAVMRACDYPLTEEHHLSHGKLYETIYALNERLASDPRPLDRETINFVKNWLLDHVAGEDMGIRDYLAARKTPAA